MLQARGPQDLVSLDQSSHCDRQREPCRVVHGYYSGQMPPSLRHYSALQSANRCRDELPFSHDSNADLRGLDALYSVASSMMRARSEPSLYRRHLGNTGWRTQSTNQTGQPELGETNHLQNELLEQATNQQLYSYCWISCLTVRQFQRVLSPLSPYPKQVTDTAPHESFHHPDAQGDLLAASSTQILRPNYLGNPWHGALRCSTQ